MQNETVRRIAEDSGARLAETLSPARLTCFVVRPSGEVEVTLADGTVAIIVCRRDAGQRQGVAAEDFISMMGAFANLPLGAAVEGRRFFRRTIIGPAGKPCDRFSEGGRDV